jgi:hypothetical protein
MMIKAFTVEGANANMPTKNNYQKDLLTVVSRTIIVQPSPY